MNNWELESLDDEQAWRESGMARLAAAYAPEDAVYEELVTAVDDERLPTSMAVRET